MEFLLIEYINEAYEHHRTFLAPVPGCSYVIEIWVVPSCSSGVGYFLFSSFCLVAYAVFSCKKVLIVLVIEILFSRD
jgi:hypothetical protein